MKIKSCKNRCDSVFAWREEHSVRMMEDVCLTRRPVQCPRANIVNSCCRWALSLLLILSIFSAVCSSWSVGLPPLSTRHHLVDSVRDKLADNCCSLQIQLGSEDIGPSVALCHLVGWYWKLCGAQLTGDGGRWKRLGSAPHLSINSPLTELHAVRKGDSSTLKRKLSQIVQLRRSMNNLQQLG